MDLRSGHPFWLVKNGILNTYPPLTTDERCEVAVIGAGVTGALVADRLTDEGVGVVVLDKRDAATGSTAASTALLQYEIDTELIELVEAIGEGPAVRCYRLGLEAIDWIENRVERLGDRCEFAQRDSLYLASSKRDTARLEREYDCRRRNGFDVVHLDESALAALYPFAAPAAIRSTGDAEIDAYRFTHRLLADARSRGARVYDRTAVTQVKGGADGYTLRTDRGPVVWAKRVVFATGYESEEYLNAKTGRLSSTFAAVSEPMDPFPEWPGRGLVWESARPYFYLRTTADGRIMIGGEDVEYASAHESDRLLEAKTRRLVERFEALIPGAIFETAFAWAGTFGSTLDGLPVIGRPPERPGEYFALGYGGNGITMSVVASQLITDDFLGRPNPDAALFRFGR
jgi:glycine/D-amino acid oxidase-like deaminating enzyme